MQPFRRHPIRTRQRGAALLTAMVIVTLVATFAASMVWQQWRAVQVEEAERVRAQASWLLRGALDWARLILREDQRNGGPDHLNEPWAIPLAESRLSTFLAADKDNNSTADLDTPEAFLSGKVEDVTARYNLRNLLSAEGEVQPEELAVLRRLCSNAGMSPTLADAVAASLRRAHLALVYQRTNDAETLARLGGEEALASAPLMPQVFDQLIWLGVDAGTLERLRPYVTLLAQPTLVNVNTTTTEVLAAVVDNLDLARASRVIQARQRNPFRDTGEMLAILGDGTWNFARLATSSDFFEVLGRLRYEDNIIEQRHLVQRQGADVVVRYENRFTGLDRSAGSGVNP